MSFPPLTEQLIRSVIDPGSFDRGQAYYRQGRVEMAIEESDGTINGLVRGSARRPYDVVLQSHGDTFTGWCSCPMNIDCKHVAAVALSMVSTVRPAPPTTGSEPARRSAEWELTLSDAPHAYSPVRHDHPPEPPTPLALRFDVTTDVEGRRRIKLSVHTRTKTGTWSKSVVKWSDFSYQGYRMRFVGHPAREILSELRSAAVPRNQYYGYGSEATVYLDAPGSAVWRYLVEAGACRGDADQRRCSRGR